MIPRPPGRRTRTGGPRAPGRPPAAQGLLRSALDGHPPPTRRPQAPPAPPGALRPAPRRPWVPRRRGRRPPGPPAGDLSRGRHRAAVEERWEEEYDGGVWDYLAGEEEATRYRAILELLDDALPSPAEPGARDTERGAVLDLGCGEGVLVDFLRAAGGSEGCRYTGVDLSERAIEAARAARGDQLTRFVVADAEAWEPGPERFDAIVLNECLYYFHEPLETLRRYLGALAPGGVVVISMYEAPRTIALARALDRHLPPLATLRLAGPPGAWRISLHRGDA